MTTGTMTGARGAEKATGRAGRTAPGHAVTSQPFFVPAVLIGLFAVPLILGLPPNRLYGVRTRKTLADHRVWYGANKLGGWCLLVSGVFYLLIAAMVPDAGADVRVWSLHLAAFVAPLVLSLLLIRSYLTRR